MNVCPKLAHSQHKRTTRFAMTLPSFTGILDSSPRGEKKNLIATLEHMKEKLEHTGASKIMLQGCSFRIANTAHLRTEWVQLLSRQVCKS